METLRFINATKDTTERDQAVINYNRLKEKSAIRSAVKAEAERLKLYRKQAIERRNEAFKQTIGDIKSDFKAFVSTITTERIRDFIFEASFIALSTAVVGALSYCLIKLIFI